MHDDLECSPYPRISQRSADVWHRTFDLSQNLVVKCEKSRIKSNESGLLAMRNNAVDDRENRGNSAKIPSSDSTCDE